MEELKQVFDVQMTLEQEENLTSVGRLGKMVLITTIMAVTMETQLQKMAAIGWE